MAEENKQSTSKKSGSAIRAIKIAVMSAICVLVILIAVFYLFGQRILKVGIETAASRALKVGVSIEDLSVSILRGKVAIKNVIVKNPGGYTYDNLLELGSGAVTADIGSLLSDTVRIKAIKLDGVNLVIEQKGLSSNLRDVISAAGSVSGGAAGTQPQVGEAGTKKLHIDLLEITGVTVKAKLIPIPGKSDTVTFKLSPIRMTNLGSDNKLSTAILANKVLVAIAGGVAKEGANLLPADMTNTLQSTLNTVVDAGKGAIQQGQKILDAGKDSGQGIIKGFEGLLKPKK